METLNLVLNLLIIGYIITKELNTIEVFATKTKEATVYGFMYIVEKLLIKTAKLLNAEIVFNDKPEIKEIKTIITESVEEIHDDVLSEEDLDCEDYLLATCIGIDSDGNKKVIDFDFRGDSAAPLNFSMFNGDKQKHYDVEFIELFESIERDTASYYAFENTAYESIRNNEIVSSYVLLATVTKEQLLEALDIDYVKSDEVVNEGSITLEEGVAKGYEVYCRVNKLKTEVEAMLQYQKNIADEYAKVTINKPQADIDMIVEIINESRYGSFPMFKSIEEIIDGSLNYVNRQ